MSQEPLPLLLNVSHNLRHARQQRGWSQERLASAAGVSRRMLVGIEAAESNVSLATLDKLAGALGLTFAEVVRPPHAQQAAVPVQVWQGRSAASQARLLQSVSQLGCTMELWEWQIEAGERYDAEPDPAGTQEMLYVISGELELERPGQRHKLTAGQSLSFASDVVYAYLNAGPQTLRFTKNVIMAAPGA